MYKIGFLKTYHKIAPIEPTDALLPCKPKAVEGGNNNTKANCPLPHCLPAPVWFAPGSAQEPTYVLEPHDNKMIRFWLQAHRILKCGLLHLSRTYILVMLWDIMRQGFLFSAFMGFSSIIFLSRYFCIFKGKFIFLRGFL